MIKQLDGDLYDYPAYYDLVFGSDWKAEFDFLQACFKEHAPNTVRLFEPACGTGRLLYRFAKAGFEVSGLDLNPRAVEYCNKRLRRMGFPASAVVGDMTRFRLAKQVDAAFNMINSFRHLTSGVDAAKHLTCVAAALNKDGLYVLGLHLTPTKGTPMDEEAWSARRGNLCVNTRLSTTKRDVRNRQEVFTMTLDVYTPSERFQLTNEIVFRTYTAPQMQKLIDSTPGLEIAGTYDFAYRVEKPIEITAATEDVVYVLRKT